MTDGSAPTRRCPTCGGLFRPPLVLCPRDATVLDVEGEDVGPDPFIGRIFGGRFAIAERLGEGGMGAVYRATQLSIGREVALKVLHPGFAARPDAAQRFAREARMLSRIHHPSVVTLFDFGQAESGELFLAMELLQGETLASRLERGPIDSKVARHIADGIAEALAIAHAEGIVHRDLKPENVWLVPTQGPGPGVRVKVLDFGLARSVAVQATTLTGPGTIFGTPVYMSPEAIAGREVGPSADLYALGLILYEMLTGDKAFERTHVEATFTAHLVEPAPVLPAGHPRALAELVRRLLEKEPARRLPSAADVRTALVAIDETSDPQRSRTWTHNELRKVGDEPAATPATTGAHPTTGSASPISAPERRRRALLFGGAIAVIVVASALIAAGSGSSGTRPTSTSVADAAAVASTDVAPSTMTTPAIGTTRAEDTSVVATVAPDTTIAPGMTTASDTITTDDATTATAIEASVGPSTPDVVAAREITLALTATPQADVRLDDQALGRTPLAKAWPAEAREATLRFSRPGYVTVTRKVRLDVDQDLRIELVKKPQEDFIVPRSP